MDTRRVILFAALAFVTLLLYQEWQNDYGAQADPSLTRSSGTETAPEGPAPAPPPGLAEDGSPAQGAQSGQPPGDIPADVPELGTEPPAAEAPAATAPQRPSGVVRVKTDVLEVQIDLNGGVIRRADLLDYPVSIDRPDVPVRLLAMTDRKRYVAQSGLISRDGAAPDHYASYSASRTEYVLSDGQDSLDVPLVWTSDTGLQVRKVFRLTRGGYVIQVDHEVRNAGSAAWTGRQYRQLQRTQPSGDSDGAFIYTYTGGVIYDQDVKYEKVRFNQMRKENLEQELLGGWVAMIEHYFGSAWVPQQNQRNLAYTRVQDRPEGTVFTLGLSSPSISLAAGQEHTFTSDLFVGPKRQEILREVAPGLELTVDYGWLTLISQPLFAILSWLQWLTGNWGVAIILLTVLIKGAFYWLSATSYRSMAKMRELHPRLQALKERYGDDRQRMNQAMMELYRTEKINPLGGCLPILVQIPVFIALYWVLLESVELRHAPFMLWIDDLSTKDPWFVLPILMGISMFIQQKLTPAPLDPMQQKVFMVLPIVFTFFFAFFPSGLVLYWLVNNTLSIAQQWWVTKTLERERQSQRAKR